MVQRLGCHDARGRQQAAQVVERERDLPVEVAGVAAVLPADGRRAGDEHGRAIKIHHRRPREARRQLAVAARILVGRHLRRVFDRPAGRVGREGVNDKVAAGVPDPRGRRRRGGQTLSAAEQVAQRIEPPGVEDAVAVALLAERVVNAGDVVPNPHHVPPAARGLGEEAAVERGGCDTHGVGVERAGVANANRRERAAVGARHFDAAEVEVVGGTIGGADAPPHPGRRLNRRGGRFAAKRRGSRRDG